MVGFGWLCLGILVFGVLIWMKLVMFLLLVSFRWVWMVGLKVI